MPLPNRIAAPEAPNGNEPRVPTRRDVTRVVAHAIDSQLGRELPAMMERLIAPALAKLSQDDQDEESARGAGGRFVSREVRELEKSLAKLTAKQANREKQIEAERAQTNALKIDGALRRHLAELGVDQHRMRGVVAIHKADAFVDDDGEVKLRTQRHGYEEDVDVASELKAWARTPEGRSFTSPPATKPGHPLGNRSKDPHRDLLAGVRELVGGGQIAIESGAFVDGAGNRGPSQTPEAIAEAKQQLMAGVRDLLAGGTLEL